MQACDLSNWLSWINKPCSEGFNTHFWGFPFIIWEIDDTSNQVVFGETSPLHLTHILTKTASKHRHVTPQIDHLGKSWAAVLRVSTHIFGISKEIDWQNIHRHWESRMWPFKSIVLQKEDLSWMISTLIYAVAKKIDGKTFILRVNIGMWPLTLIICGKTRGQHTFLQFPRR